MAKIESGGENLGNLQRYKGGDLKFVILVLFRLGDVSIFSFLNFSYAKGNRG